MWLVWVDLECAQEWEDEELVYACSLWLNAKKFSLR